MFVKLWHFQMPILLILWAIITHAGPTVASAHIGSSAEKASYSINNVSISQNNDSKNAISTTTASLPRPTTTTTSDEPIQSREMIRRKYNLSEAGDAGYDYTEFQIAPKLRQSVAKQIGLPDNPWGLLTSRVPCDCNDGVCGCCTGMFIPAWRSFGCMNLTYVPEDFAFEFKMIMNDAVLYKNRLTGRNPPPVCVRPPRFGFIRVCAEFHDLYFIGRNMHVCLDMSASFQDYEIFNRSFNCMRLGDKGVKIVRPEDGGGLHKPGVDADIDAGYDPIDDYDENVG